MSILTDIVIDDIELIVDYMIGRVTNLSIFPYWSNIETLYIIRWVIIESRIKDKI